MSFPKRRTPEPAVPGHRATLRSHRDLGTLISRVEEGDIVALERRDLDATTARALADRKPYAVINGAEFISGRFANLGPRLLADAGVLLLEADPARVRGLTDGAEVRLDGTTLYAGALVAADVRVLHPEEIAGRMDDARSGLADQLATFAHTASELVRREEGLLLHGTGAPALRTPLEGRTVVVVGPTATEADLARLRTFLREQKPVLIGVDAGADLLARKRKRPAVVVLSGPGRVEDKTLDRADEVVLTGGGEAARKRIEQRNLPVHTVATGIGALDVGLLLAHLGGARLVVPVGAHGTLEEFIDRGRGDQASAVLTRLRLGATLVEADAVPLLYTGRVRPAHLVVLLLIALAVLAFTIVATPIGNEWWHDLRGGF
ncbi:putative cytokinetic ring protein SteA [Marmoricola sp. RAF53]|uniref:putative cytokinetic ring protein SteA n=1 Tax=Marmoricola sp. RAF53 TaxID=3233059 RepID=UPI003F96D971